MLCDRKDLVLWEYTGGSSHTAWDARMEAGHQISAKTSWVVCVNWILKYV